VLACAYSGVTRDIPCDSFIPVTSREPQDGLWSALKDCNLATLERIGDAKAPGLIGHAVHDGHRAGRAYLARPDDLAIRRERVVIASVGA
jgi:dimethylamine/trimethylamine dehydrogenase